MSVCNENVCEGNEMFLVGLGVGVDIVSRGSLEFEGTMKEMRGVGESFCMLRSLAVEL